MKGGRGFTMGLICGGHFAKYWGELPRIPTLLNFLTINFMQYIA